MKAEEAKLKAKYPGLAQRPGGSDFLMKRLQKGVGERVCHRGVEGRNIVTITIKRRLLRSSAGGGLRGVLEFLAAAVRAAQRAKSSFNCMFFFFHPAKVF